MAPKSIRSWRVDEDVMDLLGKIAVATGSTTSEVMRKLLPGREWIEAAIDDNHLAPWDALTAWAADGLRRRLLDGGLSSTDVEGMKPDGIIVMYGEFQEALRLDLGLMNPDGTAPRFKFAVVPTGGQWERFGEAGTKKVIGVNQRFTVDGIETIPPSKEWDLEHFGRTFPDSGR